MMGRMGLSCIHGRKPRLAAAYGCALVLALVVATPAAARTILLDFNNVDTPHPGTGVGTSNTTTQWNVITNTTGAQPLVDSDNQPANVSLAVTDLFQGTTLTNAGGWTDPAHPWVDFQALDDYFLVQNGNATGRIIFSGAGIVPTSIYRFDLIGSRSVAENAESRRRGNYTLQGSFSDSGNSEDYSANIHGYVNHEVMSWESVVPTYNNATMQYEIVLDVGLGNTTGTTNSFGYLSAGRMTITVPEPSTGALALLGLIGLPVCWRLSSRAARRRA